MRGLAVASRLSGCGRGLRHANLPANLPAADRAAATVAEVVVLDAVADALLQELEDQVVDADRHGDVISSAGVTRGGFGRQARDVAGPVLAGAEEEGADDDARRAALDAAGERRRNGRLAQLHVRGLDHVVALAEALGEEPGDLLEHPVALGAPGAM